MQGAWKPLLSPFGAPSMGLGRVGRRHHGAPVAKLLRSEIDRAILAPMAKKAKKAMKTSRVWLILCALALAASAHAVDLRGRVVGVSDGDTLTVLDAGHRRVKVRLAEIDAPERRQPFGQRSKQSLSGLCHGRDAVIEGGGRDRYWRVVGRVRCDGIDASAEQVRRGMAWVFDRYATDRALYAIQEEARAARLGLWSDPAPIPPWEYRAARRTTRTND